MRKRLYVTWLIVIVGGIYLGWTFYERRTQQHIFIKRLQDRRAAQLRASVEPYGGDRLTILAFYAAPSIVRPGQSAQLCYGVSNAKSIRIEPHVDYAQPSFSNCLKIYPKRDTAYKLIAEDEKGNTLTADTAVQVR